jgi:DNA repair photolyase
MDYDVWKAFEPSTPSPAKRLEAVKELAREELPVGIFMAPILPYITDTDKELRAVMTQAAAHGARFVMSSFLRLSTQEVKSWFMATIAAQYPHLSEKYGNLYYRSAYPPSWYSDPIKANLRQIRTELGLKDYHDGEPKMPAINVPKHDLPPEQLSFTF